MLLTVGIIILIIEFLLIGIFIYMSNKNKDVFSKSNFVYFISVLIVNIIVYLVGQIYVNNRFDFFMLTDSIKFAFQAFAFSTNKELVEVAISNSIIYAFSYYVAILLSGLTLVSTILAFIKMTLVNSSLTIKKKKSGADIVYGYSKNAIKYAKANPNTIIWVDPNEQELSKDDKNQLFSDRIAYINKPLTPKNINNYLMKNIETYHVIIFNNERDVKYTKYLNVFISDEIKTSATVFLHIEARDEYISFINTQMSKKVLNASYKLVASCFNIYELISRKFIMENTFIDLLNKDDLNNGILKRDINVFFLGFGKVNFSMFKSCVLNNQFVGIENDKLVSKPINYYLYDSNSNVFNNELLARLQFDYDKRQIDEKLPPIEKICNLEKKTMNIKSDSFIDEIEKHINKDSLNIFFISFSSGIENASFAEVIEHYFYKKNIHIYYNIDHKLDLVSSNFSELLSPYGFKNEVLTHEIIANDALARLANNINQEYRSISNEELIKWEKLPIIEKYSNVYSAINMRFKASLIGFDYSDICTNKISKEEYENRLFENKTSDEINELKSFSNYNEYFKINLRTTLAFQEHLRWVSYYYLNNFDQMELRDIKYENNKVITKNLNEKRHACLTTYYGLDVLHQEIVSLYKQNNNEKSLLDIETYKYDFMVIDNLVK